MSGMLSMALVTLALGQASYFTPQEAEAIFLEGNAAYARGEFSAAQERYAKLLERGFGGPDVLYNLGTAHLAEGELGEAVLYLERARRAGGDAADLEANLALARGRQLDEVIGAAADPTLLERVTDAAPRWPVALAFAALWCAGFLLLCARRLISDGRLAGAGLFASILLASSLVPGGLLAAHLWRHTHVIEAVVMPATLAVRELPEVSSGVSFEVHAGLKVRLMDSAGPFTRIRLPNGVEGWAQKDGLVSL